MIDVEPTVTASEAAGNREQRRRARYLCIDGGVMRLSIRPEFRGRRALVVDISTGGIGFLLEESLATDTMLVFEWKAPGDGDAVARIAHVRHCRPHAAPANAPWLPPTPLLLSILRRTFALTPPPLPSAWLVGCEFDRPLEERDLSRFRQSLDER